MGKQDAVRRQNDETRLEPPPNDRKSIGRVAHGGTGIVCPPANDNPALNFPTCVPVTDEEVTLLHRYLSREILGLFS